MKENDIQRIKRIHKYCIEIVKAKKRFGENCELFSSDKDYQDAVCMKILQIGELSTGLSEEFTQKNTERVSWREIRGIRNIFAHHYGEIKLERVWETIQNDIPKLAKFCEEICPSLSGGIEQ